MTNSVAHWQTQAAVKDRLMRPLRDLRISVIDRCNYRCPYCMPAEVFGENGAAWMTAPHDLLGGKAPVQYATNEFGGAKVRQILNAIEYGGVV